MRHPLSILCLLLAVLASPVCAAAQQPASPREAAPPGDPPVRFPDLAPLEKDVAAQIADSQQRLSALATQPSPNRRALAAAFGELGQLYQVYSLREPAEASYRNAGRLAPEDFRWAHYLGTLLQEAGRLDDALVAFDRALAREPRDVPALLYQAEIFHLQGAVEASETAARRALAADPGSTAAKALLGQAALDRGDFREAARLLEAALAEVPAANRLHYTLAAAYRGLGDGAKAQEHLARVGPVGVKPADPLLAELDGLRSGERLHLARGKTAFQAGRPAEAAEEYRRALAAAPESVEARVNLAAALVQQGDPAAAVATLREALARDPGNATAHFNLGVLLSLEGPAPEAREHLAAAAAALPGDAEVRRTLAQVLRDAGQLDPALAEYAKAVELAPADEVARLGEAEALVRLARYGEARARLEDGLAKLPRSGLLAHGLARLLAACPDLAVRDGARAVELAFAVWQAQPAPAHAETVALAKAERGDCAEAARWQQIALEDTAKAGTPAAQVEGMKATLARYQGGAPCRP